MAITRVSTQGLTRSGTAIADVPDSPVIGAISDPGTDGYATVAFTEAATGGTVTTYTATSTPGSITATSATSPITVTGLTLSTAYTFKVKGANSTATGAESAASSSFTPITHWAPSGAYDSIATTNGSSGGATFTSIPQTYTHLQLRIITKSQGAATDFYNWRLNGNATSGNYRTHTLLGNGTSASSYTNTTGNTSAFIPTENPGTNATNVFAAIIIDILDYTNTNKYTTTRGLSGLDNNGADRTVDFQSGVWLSTAAISSITLTLSANSFASLSQFALYGIKGA